MIHPIDGRVVLERSQRKVVERASEELRMEYVRLSKRSENGYNLLSERQVVISLAAIVGIMSMFMS